MNVGLKTTGSKEKIKKLNKIEITEDRLKKYEIKKKFNLQKIYKKKELKKELKMQLKKEKLGKTKVYFRKKYKQRRNKFIPLLL